MHRANQYDREMVARIIHAVLQEVESEVTPISSTYKKLFYVVELAIEGTTKKLMHDLADVLAERINEKGVSITRKKPCKTSFHADKSWLLENMIKYER
jgi:hypothetical protein